jgi:hypothetical protein
MGMGKVGKGKGSGFRQAEVKTAVCSPVDYWPKRIYVMGAGEQETQLTSFLLSPIGNVDWLHRT